MKKLILILSLFLGLFAQSQQIAIEQNGTIKTYNDYPNSFTDDNGITTLNYSKVETLKKYEDGFRSFLKPLFDYGTQKRGLIYFDVANDVFTYEVLTLTAEELDNRIPIRISKLNFKIGMLTNHGITNDMVRAFFETIDDIVTRESLKLAWDESTFFERKDPNLINFAPMLGVSIDELNQIFIDFNGY